jgi:hypothetical protein
MSHRKAQVFLANVSLFKKKFSSGKHSSLLLLIEKKVLLALSLVVVRDTKLLKML